MDQVEEIKNKVDIVQLVSEYVKLTKAGRNFKGLCPFHGEKTPSFMVNPELQIYKCFGCGEGGDAYSFLQKMEGIEFGEALKILAKRVGITLVSYTPSPGEESRERMYKINSLAADFYHYLLTKHPVGTPARKYLKERKIGEKAIETFKMGFVPEGWDYLIKYLVGKKNFKIDDLTRAGLVVDGKYDRFRNRIIFPLNNHRGQTVGFAGRVLPGGDEKTGKYVNTPETEIYHKGDLLYGLDVNRTQIKENGAAVVVEGEVDAIASWQAGVTNVVAIKGSALTPRQVEILKRYTDTAILSLDADLAGDMAARRGIEIAEKAGFIIKVLSAKFLGLSYKDPGEWATENPKSWSEAINKATPIYDYYIDSAVDRYGLEATGKNKISKELIPIWARIDDEIVKSHYVNKLADVLGVDTQAVWKQLEKIPYSANPPSLKASEGQGASKGATKSRREVVEEYVVGLALRNNKIKELINLKVAEMFRIPFWEKAIKEISAKYKVLSAKGEVEVKKIILGLPAELRERVEELMLVEDDLDEEGIIKEWQQATEELEEIGIREKLQGSGDEDLKMEEVRTLSARLNELTKER